MCQTAMGARASLASIVTRPIFTETPRSLESLVSYHKPGAAARCLSPGMGGTDFAWESDKMGTARKWGEMGDCQMGGLPPEVKNKLQ